MACSGCILSHLWCHPSQGDIAAQAVLLQEEKAELRDQQAAAARCREQWDAWEGAQASFDQQKEAPAISSREATAVCC